MQRGRESLGGRGLSHSPVGGKRRSHLRSAGFRVIEYGPGELATLHGINERVSVVALENAAKIYRGIMQNLPQKAEIS